jgi:hypothetical protein
MSSNSRGSTTRGGDGEHTSHVVDPRLLNLMNPTRTRQKNEPACPRLYYTSFPQRFHTLRRFPTTHRDFAAAARIRLADEGRVLIVNLQEMRKCCREKYPPHAERRRCTALHSARQHNGYLPRGGPDFLNRKRRRIFSENGDRKRRRRHWHPRRPSAIIKGSGTNTIRFY